MANKERDTIASLWKNKLNENETWYLIDAKWWQGWLKYSGFNPRNVSEKGESQGPRPGPIDSSGLSSPDDASSLRFGLMEQEDYELLCAEVWDKIYAWYKGGPVFGRRVITAGTFNKVCRLELYPCMIKLIPVNGEGQPMMEKGDTRFFDKSAPLKTLIPEFEPKARVVKAAANGNSSNHGSSSSSSSSQHNGANGTAAANGANGTVAAANGSAANGSANGTHAAANGNGHANGNHDNDQPGRNGDTEAAGTAGDAGEGQATEGEGHGELVQVRLWTKFPMATGDDDSGSERVKGKDGFDVIDLGTLNRPFDELGFPPTLVPILVEVRNPDDGEWPRKSMIKTWRDFQVGDVIDGQEPTYGRWYEVTIHKVLEDHIIVKFPSYAYTSSDGKFAKDATTIAEKNAHTYNYNAKRSNYSSTYSNYNSNEEGAPKTPGIVGLRNLGNTCFMNSTLQCLSNSRSLTTFFVDDDFEKFINRDNPLGWKGRVADEYGAMMKDIWGSKYRVVAPRKFKQVLGEFAPRFSGYQQQDSSELLSFLLDGLHEDLNQVRKKPATSSVDSKGRPDAEVAEESWATYLLRNRSVIVDTFQGQLKSKLVCPECRNVSITFDPFMFLSVPLPTVRDKVQELSVVFADSTQGIVMYGVTVSKLARFSELKKGLSELCGMSAKRMVVADVWKGRIYRIFEDDASVSEIRSIDKIFVYELPELDDIKPDKAIAVQVSHLVGEQEEDAASTYGRRGDIVGLPRIMALSRGTTAQPEDIRARLARSYPNVDSYRIYVHPEDYSSKVPERELAKKNGEENGDIEINNSREAQFSLRLFWNKASDYTSLDTEKLSKHSSVEDKPEGGLEEVPLSDCIREFAREEILSETDPWRCGECKEFRQASKKFDLWKLPEVLIVHLKRFSYNTMWRDKISTVVRFPFEDLDLSEYIANPEFADVRYDLYAVSNHMGGMGGGHYTAYAKNLVDGKWYEYDDSRVSLAEEKDIISSYAYVLYYQRRPMTKKNGDAPLSSSNATSSSSSSASSSSSKPTQTLSSPSNSNASTGSAKVSPKSPTSPSTTTSTSKVEEASKNQKIESNGQATKRKK